MALFVSTPSSIDGSSRTDIGSHWWPWIPSPGRERTVNDIARQVQCSNHAEAVSGMWLKHAKQRQPPPSHCNIFCTLLRSMPLGLEITQIFLTVMFSGGLTLRVYQVTPWQGLLMANPCWLCSRNLIKSEGAPPRGGLCRGEPDSRSGQPGSRRLSVTVKRWQGHCRQSGIKGKMRTAQREGWMAHKSELRQKQS